MCVCLVEGVGLRGEGAETAGDVAEPDHCCAAIVRPGWLLSE